MFLAAGILRLGLPWLEEIVRIRDESGTLDIGLVFPFTHMISAVNKFYSRRPHWESMRQPTFRGPKTKASYPRGLGHALPENFEI